MWSWFTLRLLRTPQVGSEHSGAKKSAGRRLKIYNRAEPHNRVLIGTGVEAIAACTCERESIIATTAPRRLGGVAGVEAQADVADAPMLPVTIMNIETSF
jgi:hypothetical protein